MLQRLKDWLRPAIYLGQNAVSDRERKIPRLRSDRSRLVDEDQLGGVHAASEQCGRAGEADADEARASVR